MNKKLYEPLSARVLSADAIMNIKFHFLSLSPSHSYLYIKITITISSLLINYSLNCCHLSLNSYYSDRGSCVKCYLSCDTCSGPRRDQCVRCPSGWKLAAGECHPECPEGFFKTEFGCQKCHHYCKTCNGECWMMAWVFFCDWLTHHWYRCGSVILHFLFNTFHAGGWFVHRMSEHAILWLANSNLQNMPRIVSVMFWSRSI